MRRFRAATHLLVCLAATAALAPAAAQAGSAGAGYSDSDSAVFAADPGEANRLTVTGQPGNVVLFEDAGAPITPGRGCTAITPNRVSCGDVRILFVELEDGDDEVTTAGTFADETLILLSGDQGSDTIRGQVASYSISGGTGQDRLFGGGRTSSINAIDYRGAGGLGDMPDHNVERDDVTCAPADEGVEHPAVRVDEADAVTGPCGPVNVYMNAFVLIEGTEGPDLLSADSPPSRLFGFAGNDELRAEFGDRADGGAGDDTLAGNGLMLGGIGDDVLDGHSVGDQGGRYDGGTGDDRLFGTNASDSFTGGIGADQISGRNGVDLIRSRDGRRDRIRCGGGRDRVFADRRDSVASDCEVVTRG